ncbi:uncharacterized protein B0H18DRAFT_74023 [Fomitopsis serialis]|uniref:uncharacterized protein n=1 Tax=Fomitopsis serialis TaxID=139415 RepID=UPI002008C813|nr:uncharacterized protein B0H18DRAFT_74023 [Neoantrodia serialis]KAH9916330.1 hypothetical protein B0H18DRAFT_74023 [Neoantrodia serialis]
MRRPGFGATRGHAMQSPAGRGQPQSVDPSTGEPRREAGPSCQLNLAIDAEESGFGECLLLESAELNIAEDTGDDELIRCCYLDERGQWRIEFLPRHKARKAVAEADQRVRGGFMRWLGATRDHTMQCSPEREQYRSGTPSMGELRREGAKSGGWQHSVINGANEPRRGGCLLMELAECDIPEEAGDDELISRGHLDKNGRWIVEYLPCAEAEGATAEANRDCGWLDRGEDCTRGFSATRGRGVEDDRVDGLASFMSQWIALG